MRSKIYMNEVVIRNMKNKTAQPSYYYPCSITGPSGTLNALFTIKQLNVAVLHAAKHPENIPTIKPFWSKLLFWRT